MDVNVITSIILNIMFFHISSIYYTVEVIINYLCWKSLIKCKFIIIWTNVDNYLFNMTTCTSAWASTSKICKKNWDYNTRTSKIYKLLGFVASLCFLVNIYDFLFPKFKVSILFWITFIQACTRIKELSTWLSLHLHELD